MQSGFRRMKAMAKHQSHGIGLKRQVAQAFISGETLHALSSRHDVSRANLSSLLPSNDFYLQWVR
jgi:hypothetical protein